MKTMATKLLGWGALLWALAVPLPAQAQAYGPAYGGERYGGWDDWRYRDLCEERHEREHDRADGSHDRWHHGAEHGHERTHRDLERIHRDWHRRYDRYRHEWGWYEAHEALHEDLDHGHYRWHDDTEREHYVGHAEEARSHERDHRRSRCGPEGSVRYRDRGVAGWRIVLPRRGYPWW